MTSEQYKVPNVDKLQGAGVSETNLFRLEILAETEGHALENMHAQDLRKLNQLPVFDPKLAIKMRVDAIIDSKVRSHQYPEVHWDELMCMVIDFAQREPKDRRHEFPQVSDIDVIAMAAEVYNQSIRDENKKLGKTGCRRIATSILTDDLAPVDDDNPYTVTSQREQCGVMFDYLRQTLGVEQE